MTTKTNTAKPKSDAFAAIHIAAKGLHCVGAINKTTMREYDDLCMEEAVRLVQGGQACAVTAKVLVISQQTPEK